MTIEKDVQALQQQMREARADINLCKQRITVLNDKVFPQQPPVPPTPPPVPPMPPPPPVGTAPFIVAPPQGNPTPKQANGWTHLDGKADLHYKGGEIHLQSDGMGFQTESGGSCKRIIIEDVVFTGQLYVAFLDGAEDMLFLNCDFSQIAGAWQALLRFHNSHRVKFETCKLDNTLGSKSLLRVVDGSTVWMDRCMMKGGRIDVGWKQNDDGTWVQGGTGTGCECWITGGTYDYSQPNGAQFPLGINCYPGSKGLHISGLTKSFGAPWKLNEIDGDRSLVSIV